MKKKGATRGKTGKPSVARKSKKLPEFKFGTRNKTEAAYRDRAKVLADKYGVEFGFKRNRKLSGAAKGAITKKLRSVREFIGEGKRFRFVEMDKKTLKKTRKNSGMSPQNFTDRGAFVPVPNTGDKRKARVKITEDGRIETKVGNYVSTWKLYPSADVARDPSIIERDGKKLKAVQVFVSIKGHRGKTAYNLKQFLWYFKNKLMPDIEEAQEDAESDEVEMGLRPRKHSAFVNWLGVEFVTREHAKPNKRKR